MQAYFLTVDQDHHAQRIDNYLFTQLKGVPKSRIYKALRKGEVRVNKKRVKADYKLQCGDCLRLPPLRVSTSPEPMPVGSKLIALIESCIIYEDNDLIILNKPSGIAVHGGSGISFGIIEIVRACRPKGKFLELVHRLDRDTSGCLLIAKKSSLLKELHVLLANRQVQKTYLLLAAGCCSFKQQTVDVPLQKNTLKSGERIVVVDPEGKPSKTLFITLFRHAHMTLLLAKPITGRTHQIRVHAAKMGHPIIGDAKYGDEMANKKAKDLGINQLCLHSASIEFQSSINEKHIAVCAVLREDWKKVLQKKKRGTD